MTSAQSFEVLVEVSAQLAARGQFGPAGHALQAVLENKRCMLFLCNCLIGASPSVFSSQERKIAQLHFDILEARVCLFDNPVCPSPECLANFSTVLSCIATAVHKGFGTHTCGEGGGRVRCSPHVPSLSLHSSGSNGYSWRSSMFVSSKVTGLSSSYPSSVAFSFFLPLLGIWPDLLSPASTCVQD